VLSRQAEELVVVGSFEVMAAWALDRPHGLPLSGL
jgi:hypothetical protein